MHDFCILWEFWKKMQAGVMQTTLDAAVEKKPVVLEFLKN